MSLLVSRNAPAAAVYYEQARASGADKSIWAFQKAYCYDGPLCLDDQAIAALKDSERRDPLAASLKAALIEMYWRRAGSRRP